MKISDFSPTVAFVRIGKEKHTLILGVRTEGGTDSFTVGEAFYRSIGEPRADDPLDADTMDLLRDEHQRREAMKIALRLLAFADNSEHALCEKLRRKGVPRAVAEETVREVVRLGYLDETRALRVLVRSAVCTKLHGPYRVRAELCAKGYPPAKIGRVLSELTESGEIDFDDSFSRLLLMKAGENPSPEEIQKYKITYGYKIC